MAIKCPNCGYNSMVLVVRTDAHFAIDEDGTMGNVILDDESIDCINEAVESASAEDGDIEFKCRHCRSSFAAKPTDHEHTYEIGEEL